MKGNWMVQMVETGWNQLKPVETGWNRLKPQRYYNSTGHSTGQFQSNTCQFGATHWHIFCAKDPGIWHKTCEASFERSKNHHQVSSAFKFRCKSSVFQILWYFVHFQRCVNTWLLVSNNVQHMSWFRRLRRLPNDFSICFSKFHWQGRLKKLLPLQSARQAEAGFSRTRAAAVRLLLGIAND